MAPSPVPSAPSTSRPGIFSLRIKWIWGGVEIEHWPTENILADVLSKPKGVRPFLLYISYLMNVAVDYDNDLELLQTHPDLLPKADQALANSWRKSASVNHRSVLGYHTIAGSPLNDSRLENSQLDKITCQSDNTCQSATQRSWWDRVANQWQCSPNHWTHQPAIKYQLRWLIYISHFLIRS